jgi:hypothetical protein
MFNLTITGYDLLYRRNSLSGNSSAHGGLDAVNWQFFGPREKRKEGQARAGMFMPAAATRDRF